VKKSEQNRSRNNDRSSQPRAGSSAKTSVAPPVVSARWLGIAVAVVFVGAAVCAWATLCFLFWQGSWQLLYRPVAAVATTPASAGLPFESVGFATDASGAAQLHGWWIPAASPAHYTALYLHGAVGNLGNTVDALTRLHALGLNVFAFDYRGYGQSHFLHPSEARWQEDADSATRYLTDTRHISPRSLILVGKDLGADLALEIAASRSDLAGIVLEQPLESPTTAIFRDGRAHLVPAHLLVADRWDSGAAASNVLIPSLWFYWTPYEHAESREDQPPAYSRTPARKSLVWLTNSPKEPAQFNAAFTGWLDQLSKH
jgi:pimeloyl-ACP methyl ester carboxylesterase